MTQRLAFTVDDLQPGRHIMAVCRRCQDARYLTRPLLHQVAADQTLAEVERRVRCIARPLTNKRGPACGGAMEIEFWSRAQRPEAQAATVALAEGLAEFSGRRMTG